MHDVTFLNDSDYKIDLDESEDLENKFATLRINPNKVKLKLSESAHLTTIQTAFEKSKDNKNKPKSHSVLKANIQHLSSSPLFECKTNKLCVEDDVSLQKTGSLINFFNDKMKHHEHEQLKCERNLSKNSIFSSSIRNSLDEFDKNSESSYDSNILVPLLLLNKRKKSNVSKIDENDESSHFVYSNKVSLTETSTVRTDVESSVRMQDLNKSQGLFEKQSSMNYEESSNNPRFIRTISNDSNDLRSFRKPSKKQRVMWQSFKQKYILNLNQKYGNDEKWFEYQISALSLEEIMNLRKMAFMQLSKLAQRPNTGVKM